MEVLQFAHHHIRLFLHLITLVGLVCVDSVVFLGFPFEVLGVGELEAVSAGGMGGLELEVCE